MPYSTTINSFRFSLVLPGLLALVACGGVDELALPINEAPTASSVNIADTNGGDAVVNDRLIGNYIYTDAEDDAEGESIYRWLRNDAVIGGATTSDYILVAEDIGQSIIFEVTPVAISGAIGATTSALTGTAIASVAFVPNSSPIANAGADQTPLVNDTVTLDGSGSSDGNGDGLTYSWSFTSKPPGSQAILTGSTTLNPSFMVDVPGDYVVQLIVNDGTLGSVPNTVTISTNNSAPVADAGPDQSAVFGDTVTLDGSASSDVDGDGVTYSWSFTSRPALSAAILTGSTTLNPTFAIDVSGDYVVQLVVNDGTVDSDPDTVIISTNNTAPVANAGADQAPLVNDTVTLDGSSSSDVDGNLLSYSWSFTSVPANSTAALSDSTAVTPIFTVDLPGTYVVQLIVSDGTVDSAPDIVSISTDNSAPVADAGPDQSAVFGDTITLDGSGSSDVDGDGLTYSWSFTSRPASSTTILTGSTTLNPTFAIDVSGDYVVQLIVNDGTVDSAPDAVIISTNNSAPVANAGADQAPLVNDTVTLDGSASSDVDGDGLTFSWSFSSFPTGSTAALSDTTAVTPTFTVDLSGTYVVQLIVNDGTVDSAPEAVTITTRNSAPVLGAIGDKSINELATLSFTATATDADLPADTLTFTLDAASVTAGMTIDASTGAFSWTPAAGQVSIPSVTITVTDNGSGSLSDSETFTITVNDVNTAPVLAAIGNQSINELATLSFTATATDADLPADTLTFTLDAASVTAGMTIDASTGAFSWTPAAGQGGSSPLVTITVTDNGSGSLSDSETFTITVNDVNTAPVLAAIGDKSINETATLSFTATATDADLPADTLTFTLDAASVTAGMTIDASTGAFSWTPAAGQGGSSPSVTITVTDNGSGSLSDSETFTITVNDVNTAPVLAAIGNQSINELATLSFTATATDADLPADTLTFTLDAASVTAGMTIDASTGAFSWTPAEGQVSIPSVTITVTDNGSGSLSDSETFTITVNDVNTAPVLAAIGNQSINELATLSFTATATDADLPADTLTFTLDPASVTAGMTIDASTGAFSWTPAAGQGGSSPLVTITVTDNGSGSLSDSETFTITVTM